MRCDIKINIIIFFQWHYSGKIIKSRIKKTILIFLALKGPGRETLVISKFQKSILQTTDQSEKL